MIHTSSIRLRPLYRAVQLALAIGLTGGTATATAQAAFELATLYGDNGFQLIGVTDGDYSGRAVMGIGDINGDGLDDVIIGAPLGNNYAGSSYVVFGIRSAIFSEGSRINATQGNP